MANSKLGQTIREQRKAKGLTQKQLATKLGKGESTIRMWELGKNRPKPELLQKISELLEIPLGNLYIEAGYFENLKDLATKNLSEILELPTLGEAIKSIREEQDMSKEILAMKMHLVPSIIESIESDDFQLSKYQINELSNILNVPFSYLFALSDFSSEIDYLEIPKELIRNLGHASNTALLTLSACNTFEEFNKLQYSSIEEAEKNEGFFGFTEKEFNEWKDLEKLDNLIKFHVMNKDSLDFLNENMDATKILFSSLKINGRKLSSNDIEKILSKIEEMKDEFEYLD